MRQKSVHLMPPMSNFYARICVKATPSSNRIAVPLRKILAVPRFFYSKIRRYTEEFYTVANRSDDFFIGTGLLVH
jgi:hypothetical protein